MPGRSTALQLVRQWSLIEIGQVTAPGLRQWRISSREYREDLLWAIVVPGDSPASPAVDLLLGEIAARGIRIHHAHSENWQAEGIS
jgi:hypothetical protein